MLGEDLSTNKNRRFTLSPETRVTRLVRDPANPSRIVAAVCRNLKTDRDILVVAKVCCNDTNKYVILTLLNRLLSSPVDRYAHLKSFGTAASAWMCWERILQNSLLPFARCVCLIPLPSVLPTAYILSSNDRSLKLSADPAYKDLVAEHREKHPNDPLPIPFDDPEPQVTIPYSSEHPWHTQIHRNAFSYGDVGPRSDPRVVVDLHFFGKSYITEENQVTFSDDHTDIYGLPQPTFSVKRSREDGERDHR